MTYPIPATLALFPAAWSSYGFTTANWSTYPFANNAIIGVANASTNQLVPINANLDGFIVNAANYALYFGFVGNGVLYPLYLTGPYIRLTHDIYRAFIKSCQYVKSPSNQLVKPEMHVFGKAYTMLSEVTLDYGGSTLESLVPNGLSIVATSIEAPGTAVNVLSVYRSPITSLTCTMMINKARAYLAMIYGWIGTLDQAVTRSTTQQVLYRAIGIGLMTGAPLAVTPGFAPNPIGKFQITPPSGNSMNSATGTLIHAILDSQSTFADAKARIDKAKGSVTSLIPRSMLERINKLGYTQAFESVVHAMANRVFSGDLTPNIQSKHLGTIGKGMSDNVSDTVAVIESGAGVSAAEHQSVGNEPTVKKKSRKFDGHRLKKVAKVLKSATNTVKTGVDTAIKLAGDVSAVSEQAAMILGGL